MTVADLMDPMEPMDPQEARPFDEYVKRGGPLQLLEAVYCDPCKAKVSFSILCFTKYSRLSVLW